MELMKRRARKEKRKRDRERKKPALVCFALFCFALPAPLAWGTLQRDRQSNTETTPFLTFIITVIPLTEMFNRGA